jgi:hypothetical protein
MELREYQLEAVNKCLAKIRAGRVPYLASETRTGKTIMALTVANEVKAESVLFLTKKKAISSVLSDFKESNCEYRLTVTNYEQADKLNKIFDFVIIDESHNIGRFPKPSKRAKNIKALCKGATVLLLSATPCPESYSQIYHQLWICDNNPLKDFKNFYAFAKRFVSVRKQRIAGGQEVNDYSQVTDEFKRIIQPLFITVTQEQAGFNQVVKEHFHTVEMAPQTTLFFHQLRKNKVISGEEVTADTPAKLLQKCHQVASGTIINDLGEYLTIDSSKIDYIRRNFEGKKIAIFYKFKSELELIKGEFQNIAKTAEEFNSTDHKTIYAGQFQSSREGVNLKSADCIVMLNIDFSAVSYMQSINRLQSKDRETPAEIHWIFSDLGIEKKIYQTVKEKQRNYTSALFLKDF